MKPHTNDALIKIMKPHTNDALTQMLLDDDNRLKKVPPPVKSRYQHLVEKHGVELAKSIEDGFIKEPKSGLKMGSYNSKKGKKKK